MSPSQNATDGPQIRPSHIDLPDGNQQATGHARRMAENAASPLNMPPGAIHGLESIQESGILDLGGRSPQSETSSLLQLPVPGFPSGAELALVAVQYLPTPLIVLNSLKTVVLANEAMGRLLGYGEDTEGSVSDDGISASDRLMGKTLNQVGVDMIQDGRCVFVSAFVKIKLMI